MDGAGVKNLEAAIGFWIVQGTDFLRYESFRSDLTLSENRAGELPRKELSNNSYALSALLRASLK